ncbi:outer membrane adhesin-like protein [Moraxella macacae 0408225]|uniref:Outer membrane adhesin-like protein n=1 Tax=Moraxella macacae 0408225 TaxID=1230338 RepID=L2F8W9_9GAMM|nr:hypothetical protein [Moraxella macacae]ELA09482.1 outer membrane adhesin-like protein [Moraxella macacae 0408225]
MDSVVEGLEVLQKGKSLGKTNVKGEFNYNTAGGKVTFKLGELTLGETEPKSIVTPSDLINNEQTTRILQILQSISGGYNSHNLQEVRVIYRGKQNGRPTTQFKTILWLDNNEFSDGGVHFSRASTLAFDSKVR